MTEGKEGGGLRRETAELTQNKKLQQKHCRQRIKRLGVLETPLLKYASGLTQPKYLLGGLLNEVLLEKTQELRLLVGGLEATVTELG